MKRRILSFVCALLSCALLSPCAAFAAAGSAAEGSETPVYNGSVDVSRLDLPQEAVRLVTVEARGLSAKVSMFDVSADESGQRACSLIMSTDEGLIGRKGMGKTVEGDEKTPCGLFKMNTPFGISDPREGFPENYLKVDGSYYWNGDSASPMYNKLVSTSSYTDFDRGSSEHLSDYGGYYNYCIDTGYNFEGTPGLGSAIFLHCSMGINTGGCIAIPEADMITVMRNYVEGGTWILLDTEGNFEKYYRAFAEDEAESLPEIETPEMSETPVENTVRVIYAPSAGASL